MKTLVLTAGICMAASIASLAHAYQSVSASKIDKLVAFTTENTTSSVLNVFLESESGDSTPRCGSKTGYALKTSGSANQTAAALLNAAFLNSRGVTLEIEPALLTGGRCTIVMVSLD